MNKSKVGIILAGLFLAILSGIQANKASSFGKGAGNEAASAVPVANATGSQACDGAACLQAGTSPEMALMSQVVVYYFRSNARCPSCYRIEQYAKEAVEQNFAEEMKAGTVIFKVVNVDQRENSHFVNDYQLYTKSVVISLVKDGKQVRYKNLERVWDLLRDPNQYHAYVRDEIKPFLGGLS